MQPNTLIEHDHSHRHTYTQPQHASLKECPGFSPLFPNMVAKRLVFEANTEIKCLSVSLIYLWLQYMYNTSGEVQVLPFQKKIPLSMKNNCHCQLYSYTFPVLPQAMPQGCINCTQILNMVAPILHLTRLPSMCRPAALT